MIILGSGKEPPSALFTIHHSPFTSILLLKNFFAPHLYRLQWPINVEISICNEKRLKAS
jgi:hypothetical protein